MPKFIEISVYLRDNDPDDDTDYEGLGLEEPDWDLQEETILLNVDNIVRVNKSSKEDYNSIIWTVDGDAYLSLMEYDQVRELIGDVIGRIPTFENLITYNHD